MITPFYPTNSLAKRIASRKDNSVVKKDAQKIPWGEGEDLMKTLPKGNPDDWKRPVDQDDERADIADAVQQAAERIAGTLNRKNPPQFAITALTRIHRELSDLAYKLDYPNS